jgi:hypothetical protein
LILWIFCEPFFFAALLGWSLNAPASKAWF